MGRKWGWAWIIVLALVGVGAWLWVRKAQPFVLLGEYATEFVPIPAQAGFLTREGDGWLQLRDWLDGHVRWRVLASGSYQLSPDGRWLVTAVNGAGGERVTFWEDGTYRGLRIVPFARQWKRDDVDATFAVDNAGRATVMLSERTTATLTVLKPTGMVTHGSAPAGAQLTRDGTLAFADPRLYRQRHPVTGTPVMRYLFPFTSDNGHIALQPRRSFAAPAMFFPGGVVVDSAGMVHTPLGSRHAPRHRQFWMPVDQYGRTYHRLDISSPWTITTDDRLATFVQIIDQDQPSAQSLNALAIALRRQRNRAYAVTPLGTGASWTLRLPKREINAPVLCNNGFAISDDGRYVLTRANRRWSLPAFLTRLQRWLPSVAEGEFRLYERPGRLRAFLPLEDTIGSPGMAYLSPDGHSLLIYGRQPLDRHFAVLHRW